ncbi:hypothetical protein M513_06159 [Trichuris suis]|uniref:Methionine synthase reductase n=1 Tax=Trichuris suis TaxID=68888 RepID=A0A085M747_9BILA|nr:hypothetical protein M513_06159 [Trichuris suis]
MTVGSNILIAYASQTGQAKSIASLLYESLNAKGLAFHIEQESCVIFVVSTTGDGDPPDTAHLFFTQLKRKAIAKERLEFLNYALLGLGDSNYNTFCGSPKRLESLLLKLGAHSFFPTAFCDDAVGTDTVAEPWMADLTKCLESQVDAVPSLEKSFDRLTLELSQSQAKDAPNVEHCSPGFSCQLVPPFYCSDSSSSEARSFYTFEDCHCRWPFPSVVYSDTIRGVDDLKVPSLDQLTPWLASAVSHEDFGLPSAYQPGDSLCFICPNSDVEVNWLLYRLNLGVVADKVCRLSLLLNSARRVSKLPSHLPERSSLRYLLTHCLDIRQCPTRVGFKNFGKSCQVDVRLQLMLRLFADHCENHEEKRRLLELCSSEGQQEYQKFIRQSALSVLDVLHAFRTCLPPIDRLLELLGRLKPRPYSFAWYALHTTPWFIYAYFSSPLVSGSVGDFVYSLQELSASEGRFFYRQGVATGYLRQLKPGDQVTAFLKEAGTFRLPENLHTPIVMIGPGTGVAPYVGFLRQIRLNLGVVADKVCRLSLLLNSARRVSKLPSHLPERSSLRYLLTHCLDIRQCPTRVGFKNFGKSCQVDVRLQLMLRLFADHCENHEEKRRLLELCSSEGQQEYQKFIRQSALSVLDVLHAFRTCLPPIDRLLELLGRLKPRPYSFAWYALHTTPWFIYAYFSSPLVSGSVGDFVYSLQELSASEGRFFYRQGVATGYLRQLKPGDQVTAFLKEAGTFRLPENLHTPIVMIGPGTGVAPYVGFLRHIREELEEFNRDGILSHLVVAFSKEEPRCYIQDNLRTYGPQLVDLITQNSDSRVYICGDVENMMKQIFSIFVEILEKHAAMTKVDATDFLVKMQANKRYILDYWI